MSNKNPRNVSGRDKRECLDGAGHELAEGGSTGNRQVYKHWVVFQDH